MENEAECAETTQLVPFLRWAGSKRRTIHNLTSLYSPTNFKRYFEPFVGCGALFFAARPKTAILSDINSDLIEALTAVRDQPETVHAELARLSKDRESYYEIRKGLRACTNPLVRAVHFIYLNRLCFNGLYRTDRLGNFNVPYGVKTGRFPTLEHLSHCSAQLKCATLICGDFERIVLENVRRGDFVYLDPPYAVENRRVFRQYRPDTFGIQDLSRLAALLREIHRRRASFVLSYAYCKESKEFFGRWPHRKLFIQRHISGFGKHRRHAAEMLATNLH